MSLSRLAVPHSRARLVVFSEYHNHARLGFLTAVLDHYFLLYDSRARLGVFLKGVQD